VFQTDFDQRSDDVIPADASHPNRAPSPGGSLPPLPEEEVNPETRGGSRHTF
jgi:hypothetical protein